MDSFEPGDTGLEVVPLGAEWHDSMHLDAYLDGRSHSPCPLSAAGGSLQGLNLSLVCPRPFAKLPPHAPTHPHSTGTTIPDVVGESLFADLASPAPAPKRAGHAVLGRRGADTDPQADALASR
jgi:hypothetical protein